MVAFFKRAIKQKMVVWVGEWFHPLILDDIRLLSAGYT
jgi:hypothetical protein